MMIRVKIFSLFAINNIVLTSQIKMQRRDRSDNSRSRSPLRRSHHGDYQQMKAYAIPMDQVGVDILLKHGGSLIKKARDRFRRLNICLNTTEMELVLTGKNLDDIKGAMKHLYNCMQTYGKYYSES